MRRAAILLALFAILPACKRSELNEAKWKEAGEAAVRPFKQSLKGALMTGMESGPAEAIAVCRVDAPRLAKDASVNGVRVGRASSKLRNPNNAAKPWIKPLLEVYEADPERREPAVVLVDDQTVGYVEPLFVQPLCVTCHGSDIAPDLQKKLSELYPDDQATGYVAGDLRGVFWAELPRE